MSEIISPCNGLAKCFRHPTGCARLVISSRERYEMQQRRKAARRRLWNLVLEDSSLRAKWGLNPLPRRYHLQAVLLLERAERS